MIPFVKAQACGNDFLIIDEAYALNRHAEVARLLCARTFSIGADGVEFLDLQTAEADVFGEARALLRLFNADGSEAELSGNGTRCVAAWLAYRHKITAVRFGTHGGERACRVVEAQGEHFVIQSQMGVPVVKRRGIVVQGVGMVEGAYVDVGNPHFVIFTKDRDFYSNGLSWQELGAKICVHPEFPRGTNVEFVRVLAKDAIEFRIFERGVGPTTSSGTGTCASSAASMALQGCARSLTATSIGGAQKVSWPADDEVMLLTGPAEIVCKGDASVQSLGEPA